MAYYGVELDSRIQEVNHQFKQKIKARGGIGIRSLGRIFRQIDENGNKKLDAYEFEQALAQFGLFPKKQDLQALIKYYDIDQDGNITYEEFVRGLREPMTDRKKKMVEKVFASLDRDGSGVATVQEVLHLYDVQQHPDFKAKKKTREQIVGEFLDGFDGAQGNGDGKLTKQEFMDYYTDLAMSLPSEEYFIQMLESTWACSEDSGSQIFKDQIMRIIGLMRNRLIDISNNSQEEYMLRKIFNDFDTNKSGNLTLDELAALVAKLGVSVDRKYLQGVMQIVDSNNSGAIEFEEFANFIIYDPYK